MINRFLKSPSPAATQRTRRALTRRGPAPLALEPRIMFDAAGAEAVLSEAAAERPAHAEPAPAHTAVQIAAVQIDSLPVGAPAVQQRSEIVFIEDNVVNLQQLIAAVRPEVEVVILDHTRDGLQQINTVLQDHAPVDAVHVFSHGSAGQIELGSTSISHTSMDNNAGVNAQLAQLGQALAPGGDLLIYGCDVAAGDTGGALIDRIAALTGADVAASVDVSGSSAFGGDWQLEYQHGVIETAGALADGAAWEGRLPDATVYNANGAQLTFNGATSIIGNGTANGNVMRFSSVITIDGQAIDAVVTTTIDRVTINTFDSTSQPSTTTAFFQPNITVTSAGGGATFKIDFYKAGTYTGVGTGTAVTLQNVVVNSYDIDGIGASNSDRQYQQFRGFARYELSTATMLVPTTQPDGSVIFQYVAASAVNSGNIYADQYRVKVYYDSITSIEIKSGATAQGAGTLGGTAYFALDFSIGPGWSGATNITGTPAANVSYSATSFAESAANNGAIGTGATITLANGTFSGTDGQALAGVTFSNTPAGLTPVVTRTSATTASVTFSGQAGAHANANDIGNFGIALGNAAFSSGNAGAVTGAARADLGIDFIDPPADSTAPVIGAGQLFTYAENRPGATLIGTVAASDAIGVTGFRFASNSSTTSADGFFSIAANGELTLTAAGAHALSGRNDYDTRPGADTYALQARDAAGNWSATQNVTVALSNIDELAPVFSSGTTGNAAEAQNLLYTAAASDAVDFTNQVVTYTLKPATGDVALLTINSASGAVTLASGNLNAATKASYSFTVVASDATGNTRERAVTLTVTPGNRAPVAANGAFTTAEDTAASGTLPAGTDADGDLVTYGKASDPSHGTVTVGAGGSYAYTPVLNYHGSDSFTYTVSDGNGGSNTYTVSVTVTPVNDAPAAAAASISTTEDSAVSGSLPAATDADGDSVTFFKASDPAHGTAIVAANGSYTYTPAANYHGSDSFTYTVSDGNGGSNTYTINVSVAPINDAPVAAAASITTAEDSTVNGTLPLATDADGDSVTYSKASNPAHGSVTVAANGSYSYAPAANYHGADSFTYTVSDGNGGSNTYTIAITVTPVNDAPVAAAASITTSEDSPVNGTLPLATDADGDSVTYSKASNPAHGSVTVAANGSYSYAPAANYHGSDSFTYSVNDGNGGSNTYTIAITVTPVNDAPVAAPASITTIEDSPVNGTLPSAADADDDSVTFAKASDPAHGSITIAADGSYTYAPAANYHGSDSFTYSVSDASGGTNTYTVNVSVTPVNDAPVAAPASITTTEDIPVNGTLPAATDVDGDSVTFAKASDPAHGSVTIAANGSYAYAPAADYHGTDSFTYTVSDGNGGSNTYAVSVTVTPANDAPVAAAASITTAEDTLVSGNLPSATDADGDNVSFAKASDPAHGSVTVAANGSYTYAPAANYHGSDSFTYTVSDGNGGSNTYTVSVTVIPVNDAPVAAASSIATTEDSAVSGALPAATDADGDSVIFAQASNPAHGSVTVAPDGSYTYTPAANYHGSDSFNYTVSDSNGGSNTYTVNVTVTPVNDAPVAAAASISTAEDSAVNGTLPGASDADGDNVTFAKASDPAHGSVTVAADGSYTYIPAANYHGADSFTYAVSDDHGGSTTYTVSVTVTPINDAPVAAAASINTSKNIATSGVLPAATDADGDTVTFAKAGDPAHGSVTVDASGSYVYTPAPNYAGTDSFSYSVSDVYGASNVYTVTVTIAPSNAAPIAAATAFTVQEDGSHSDQLPPATDADNDAITYALETGPAHGVVTLSAAGDYVYTPAANYHGPDVFTYRVIDTNGSSNSYAVTIDVTALNDAPTAADSAFETREDEAHAGLLPAALDADGDSVFYSVAATPLHGTVTIAAGGSYTYIPAADYYGADAFTYIVTDGAGGISTYEVAITVLPVNDAPVATTAGSISVSVKADEALVPVAVTFSDIDSAPLTYSATLTDGSPLPAWLRLDSTSAILSGTPPAGIEGTFTLVVKASDGSLDASKNVTLTVNPITGPAQVITIGTMSRDSGNQAGDFVTADGGANRTVSGTLARPLGAGESVQVSSDGGRTWITALTTGTGWQATDPGAHTSNWTIEARVLKADATAGTQAARVVVLDTVAPAVPTAVSAATFDPLPVLSGRATPGPGDIIEVTVAGSTYIVQAPNGVWTLDLAAAGATPLEAGREYPIVVTLTDAAGNKVSAPQTAVVSVGLTPVAPVLPAPDSVAPVASISPPPVASNDAGAPVAGEGGSSLSTAARPLSPAMAAFDNPTAGPLMSPAANDAPNYGRVVISGDTVTPRAVTQAAALSDVYTRNDGFRTVVAKADEPMLVLFHGVPDQYADSGSRMMLTVPADAFVHTQSDAVVSLSATQQDGRPLPAWVHFNAQTGQFSGEVPKGLQGELRIKIVARDSAGREANALFRVNLGKTTLPAEGKGALSEQLRKAGTAGRRP